MVQYRVGAVGVGGLETAMRIGHDDADTLMTYPPAHNLSVCEQPIRVKGCVGLGRVRLAVEMQPLHAVARCPAGSADAPGARRVHPRQNFPF